MKDKLKIISLVIGFIFLFIAVQNAEAVIRFEGFERETNYSEYFEEYGDEPRPDREISIAVEDYTDTNMPVEVLSDFADREGYAVMTVETLGELEGDADDFEEPYIEWEVDIEESGLYNIEIEYYPVAGRTSTIQRDLWINGDRPFQEARYFEFSRVWGDAYDALIDVEGNQIRPRQVETPHWRRVTLRDSLGYRTEPFEFYFKEGRNTLRLNSLSEPMVIGDLKLYRKDELPDYAELRERYQEQGYEPVEGFGVEEGKVQGQDASYRSSNFLSPYFDRGDPTMEPYHPVAERLNAIGGHRWDTPGQWISWEVEVPKSGLYQIAFKTKQDQQRGVPSHRELRINGQIPFREVLSLSFNHSNYYQMSLIGDERDEPYLFYLDEGVNEISLQVNLGQMAPIVRRLEDELYNMNRIYRRIIMITSRQPDPLRDYQLEQRIPGIVDALGEQADFFFGISEQMQELTGQKSELSQMLETVAIMLERMSLRPHRIPDYLPQYRDNIGSIGQWINRLTDQPLAIDYLIVSSPGEELPRANPNFWDVLVHESRAFISSFTYDFERIGTLDTDQMVKLATIRERERLEEEIREERILGELPSDIDIEDEINRRLAEIDVRASIPEFDPDREINVWIGMGRDQAQTLKQMVEDTFSPETGITVDLQLITNMGGLLIPATIAGTAPDVAIGAAQVQLAFRGALHDLSEFDDFEEISERFHPSAFTPFTFRDEVYALPEMQAFAMMFYREDILRELGLEIPRTWDDIYEVLPVLQRHNMNFGLVPNMGSMLMFLYQQRVSLFYPDMVKTNLDSETAIRTLQQMSDLYTLYDLPYEYNPQNRFRMGEMPLLVNSYGFFQMLQVFAPELRGEWDFTLIPGTRQPDGTVSHTNPVSGSGNPALVGAPIDGAGTGGAQRSASATGLAGAATTGTVIMDASDNKDDAWEFLKWWTSAESQARFGQELESLMGAAARYATANMDGMQRLPWSPEQRNTLLEQWQWVDGIPPVPGGYYINRQFNWLFRAVVLQDEPVRESVQDYIRRANRELERKRTEFDFETTLEDIDERWIRQYWNTFLHVDRLELPEYRDLR